ncbi:MAG: Ig-like domain-containing protein, partial [Gemmatimonadota bacterium]
MSIRPDPTPILALAFALTALAGCGGDGTGPDDGEPVPTAITLSADSLSFDAIGDAQTLTATVTDQDGNVIADASVDWSSSDAAVAQVDGSGRVESVGVGEA